MNRFFLSTILLVVFSSLTDGQTINPLYERYGVPIFTGKLSSPTLDTKEARLFRSALRRAAKKGVNFGGRYALTYWGCGASCGVGAIIDLRTGRVTFPPQLDGVWAQEWPENKERIPFGYRRNSLLLVLHGYPPGDYNGNRSSYGYHYFTWNGRTLKRIKFVSLDNSTQ